MVFKSTSVAVLVSSLLVPTALATNSGDVLTTSKSSDLASTVYAEQVERGTYTVVFESQSAGLQQKSPATKERLAKITQVQQQAFNYIKSYDPQAVVNFSTRLLSNMLSVNMSKEAADAVQTQPSVQSVYFTASIESNTASLAAKSDDGQGVSGDDDIFDKTYPFLKVNPADNNVTVAIIGSGVDYTHAALGGSTEEFQYGEAFNNLTNAWSGFPNDVVITGFDFASESHGYDYNPLEYHSDITDRRDENLEYRAGYGTMTAFEVLKLVPNAKIMAYKTSGVSYEGDVFTGTRYDEHLVAALEMAIDPNLDGDSSDRADIIVLSTHGVGGYGFVDDKDTAHSAWTLYTQLVRDISATGTLVVVGAGTWGSADAFYNIGPLGIVPEALTVGFVNREDNSYSMLNSPIGPTRGPNSFLKPDIVAVTNEADGPAVGSQMGSTVLDANNQLAIARAAGAAASVMDEHPELTSAEVKALIVNTGIDSIEGNKSIAQIGGGSVNPITASTAPVFMIQKGNYQPSLNFDQVEVATTSTFSKEVIIKNVSDKSHQFNVIIDKTGNTKNNDAVSVSFPQQIIIPANSEITVPVAITVDANKLARNQFMQSQDFSSAAWQEYAVSGMIRLQHEISPGASIHMPWLIMPRRGSTFEVNYDPSTGSDYVKANDFSFNPPHDADWRSKAGFNLSLDRNRVEMKNITNVEQTLYALPVIYHAEENLPSQGPVVGNIVQTIAGAIQPEEQCLSGEKLTIALAFFDQLQVPQSKHYDRNANMLGSISFYDKETVETAEYSARTLDQIQGGAGQITRLEIMLTTDAQLVTQYVDFSIDYDPYQPLGRFKHTELDTIAVPGGNVVVSNICTDKVMRGRITPETFNEIVGIQFASDRGATPGYFDKALVHNFNLGGNVVVGEQPDEQEPEEVICDVNQQKDSQGNCLPLYLEDTDNVNLSAYIADALDTTIEPFNTRCGGYNEQGNTTCTASHSKVFNITFSSPTRNPGNISCDFEKDSLDVICAPSNLIRDNGDLDDRFLWEFPVNLSLMFRPTFVDANTSFLTGIAIKVANDSLADENKIWRNQVTVAAGESAVVSYFQDNACGGTYNSPGNETAAVACTIGALVFEPVSGFARFATNDSSYSTLKPGQQFSVSEDAPIGYEIGTVVVNSRLLKETFSIDRDDRVVRLIDGGYGTPFALSNLGVLSVRDPHFLDFETQQSYQLKVAIHSGNYLSDVGTLEVNVRNANDNAPQQLSSAINITATQNKPIEAINLSQFFTDLDGIGLAFSATGLPEGIRLDKSGLLHGTPTIDGEHVANVIVSDGLNTHSSDITFDISADENISNDSKDSSGGSMAFLLVCFIALSRRYVINLGLVSK